MYEGQISTPELPFLRYINRTDAEWLNGNLPPKNVLNVTFSGRQLCRNSGRSSPAIILWLQARNDHS